MKVVYGDLIQLALAGQFDVIIHGCNCFCTMGAGIAKAIRREFPEAFAADQATIKGEHQKLGTMSTATVERHGQQLTIVNGYTQYRYGSSGRLADYEAIRAVMRRVKAQFGDKRIGYPRIGAGLARGEWPIIAQIIDEELAGTDHTLVEYQTQ